MGYVCKRHDQFVQTNETCRWCEPLDKTPSPPTLDDYVKALGDMPIFSKRMNIDPPLVIKKVSLLPGALNRLEGLAQSNPLLEDLPYREPVTALPPYSGCKCAVCDFVRKQVDKESKP